MKLYRIDEGLYTRGHTRFCAPEEVVGEAHMLGIRTILCVAPRNDPPLIPAARALVIEYKHFPMKDGKTIDEDYLMQVVEYVLERWEKGGVIVHCNAGRNRSCFVAALAYSVRNACSYKEALTHVRERRPRAINNAAFAAYLGGALEAKAEEVTLWK